MGGQIIWYLKVWKICGAFNKFPDFFLQVFKIVVTLENIGMLLLHILWDDWPIFIISGSNEQLQQELEYTYDFVNCVHYICPLESSQICLKYRERERERERERDRERERGEKQRQGERKKERSSSLYLLGIKPEVNLTK